MPAWRDLLVGRQLVRGGIGERRDERRDPAEHDPDDARRDPADLLRTVVDLARQPADHRGGRGDDDDRVASRTRTTPSNSATCPSPVISGINVALRRLLAWSTRRTRHRECPTAPGKNRRLHAVCEQIGVCLPLSDGVPVPMIR